MNALIGQKGPVDAMMCIAPGHPLYSSLAVKDQTDMHSNTLARRGGGGLVI